MIKIFKNHKLNLEIHDNIYEVSNWTIFKKNFLAGLAHSIGIWFFNIILLAALAYISIPFFGPVIKQLTESLTKNLNVETIEQKR
jgi:hypothetical protein